MRDRLRLPGTPFGDPVRNPIFAIPIRFFVAPRDDFRITLEGRASEPEGEQKLFVGRGFNRAMKRLK